MKQDSTEKSIRRARNGAILLIIAVFVAALVTFLPSFRLPSVHGDEEAVDEEPKVTYIAARPSVEPTPTPTVTSLKVSTFGTELTADGFTPISLEWQSTIGPIKAFNRRRASSACSLVFSGN